MNSLRVNLLKPAECRYQGAVSREFAVRVTAWGGGALLLLLAVIGVVDHYSVKRQLAVSRESWKQMEPRYERVQAVQATLGQCRAVQKELASWHEARVPWHELLLQLQQLVPAEVQLTKLQVRGDFLVLPDQAGDDEERPAVQFSVRLDGRTSGELADQVVVDFLNALRAQPAFADEMASIKLQGLQRAVAGEDEEAQRMFGIEGVTKPKVF